MGRRRLSSGRFREGTTSSRLGDTGDCLRTCASKFLKNNVLVACSFVESPSYHSFHNVNFWLQEDFCFVRYLLSSRCRVIFHEQADNFVLVLAVSRELQRLG